MCIYRYYEFEALTTGYMKVGWTKACADPSQEIGMDENSYGFDGICVSYRLIMVLKGQ